jgi:hypothetical protein
MSPPRDVCKPDVPVPAAYDVLSVRERVELTECEATISAGIATFIEVGTALAVIRDKRLYRATHKDFEAYLRERWSLSRPEGYRLISGASVARDLSPIGDTNLNLGQTRELAVLRDADERREAYRDAMANVPAGGKVTAAVIRESVAKLQEANGRTTTGLKPAVVQLLSKTSRWLKPRKIAETLRASFPEADTSEIASVVSQIRRRPPQGMFLDTRDMGDSDAYRLMYRRLPGSPTAKVDPDEAGNVAIDTLPLIAECIEIMKRPDVVGRNHLLVMDYLTQIQRWCQALLAGEPIRSAVATDVVLRRLEAGVFRSALGSVLDQSKPSVAEVIDALVDRFGLAELRAELERSARGG